MPLLSRPLRPRRNGEWSGSRGVTFIVTLAAHRSVTLAARKAGMSRKSAYALKARDPAFAAAWALKNARNDRQGDEVQEVDNSRTSLSQGDKARRPAPSATRTSSAKERELGVARPSLPQ